MSFCHSVNSTYFVRQKFVSNLNASYENRILMNWCIAAKIGKWTY